MLTMLEYEKTVIEASGATPLAALMTGKIKITKVCLLVWMGYWLKRYLLRGNGSQTCEGQANKQSNKQPHTHGNCVIMTGPKNWIGANRRKYW